MKKFGILAAVLAVTGLSAIAFQVKVAEAAALHDAQIASIKEEMGKMKTEDILAEMALMGEVFGKMSSEDGSVTASYADGSMMEVRWAVGKSILNSRGHFGKNTGIDLAKLAENTAVYQVAFSKLEKVDSGWEIDFISPIDGTAVHAHLKSKPAMEKIEDVDYAHLIHIKTSGLWVTNSAKVPPTPAFDTPIKEMSNEDVRKIIAAKASWSKAN